MAKLSYLTLYVSFLDRIKFFYSLSKFVLFIKLVELQLLLFWFWDNNYFFARGGFLCTIRSFETLVFKFLAVGDDSKVAVFMLCSVV